MKSFLTPRFIGREKEIQQLKHILDVVKNGSGRCVFISGEAGIGKSRLISEIRAMATNMDYTALSGRCFEQDLSFPYAPWVEILRSYLDKDVIRNWFEGFDALAVELVRLLPEIKTHLPDSPKPTLIESEVEKRRLFEALSHLFLQQSTAGPVILTVEDLHWSDQSSLEFLLYLVRRLGDRPLLLLISFRSSDAGAVLTRHLADLDREPNVQEIKLVPLTQTELGALLMAILDQPHMPSDEFVEGIFNLTEGNPFFAEEVCASLISSGDIFFANRQWQRRPLSQIDIPDSIQRLVEKRLEQISQPARQLIDMAAVSGRKFDFAVLRTMTGLSEIEVVKIIKELVSARLVIEEDADQFSFRHALTREALYGRLLARERQILHAQVFHTIEQILPNGSDSLPGKPGIPRL